MIYGYDFLVNSFKKLADQKQLAHAYLFFGDSELGKFLFAKSLANYLENKVFEEPQKILNDSLFVDINSQEKFEKFSSESIGIETVREMERFLHQTPVFSPYRLVIIRDAEWLTDQAQNALLKIVEEPPLSGIIVIISQDLDVFLPTLSSRLFKVYFPRLSFGDILDFLLKYGKIKENERREIAEKSFGRIGRALKILEKKNDLKKIQGLISSIFSHQLSSLNDLTEKIISLGEKNSQQFDLFFEELILKLNEKLPQTVFALSSVVETLRILKTLNVNKKIQIKKMLMEISKTKSFK